MKTEKFILDATAGFRMMWFNKSHPNTIYLDKRSDEKIFEDYCQSERVHDRPANNVKKHEVPTIQADFKRIPYPNNSFKLAVFDPPCHTKLSDSSWVAMRWGKLRPETWQSELKKGFQELWRVLQPYGILIFKWNTKEIPIKKVLRLFPVKPLFGQRFKNVTVKKKRRYSTYWFCFMKIPSEV